MSERKVESRGDVNVPIRPHARVAAQVGLDCMLETRRPVSRDCKKRSMSNSAGIDRFLRARLSAAGDTSGVQ
jgi:hypothetical protein